jgi:DNA-binding LacI/PurR family transcriptional regulator
MPLTPKRISLITQTQEVLQEGMRSGRWRHTLPGERSLSEELRVSRWTLRAALAELGRIGCLRIKHGHACTITSRALPNKRSIKKKRIALLSPIPLPRLRQFAVVWIDELKSIFREHDIELNVLDSAKAYRAKPAHALKILVETHPHDGWLLLLSTQTMQQWFQARGLAAVIAGSPYPGIRLPSLDVDQFATGVHVARTVHGLGHRRVALMRPDALTAGILACEMGIRDAIKKARTPMDFSVITVGEEKHGICRILDRSLSVAAPPSVLITSRADGTLTALSHFYSRGWHVPKAISLVAIEWEPFLANVVPDISHYRVSPLQYARRAARIMLKILDAPTHSESAVIVPDFVAGGSLVSSIG